MIRLEPIIHSLPLLLIIILWIVVAASLRIELVISLHIFWSEALSLSA